MVERKPQVNGSAPTVHYERDVKGNLTSVADTDGNLLLFDYDDLNRPIWISENGGEVRRTYDGLERVASETNQLGNWTRYGYDLLGNRTVTSHPHPDGRDAQQQTIDDAEARLSGNWQIGDGGFGNAHRFSDVPNESAPIAVWSFEGLYPDAAYEVLLTWDPDSGNADHATYTFSSQGSLLEDSVTVDQREIAGDVLEGDRVWQRLATLVPGGTVLDVTLEGSSSHGRLVADALRLVEVAGNSYASYDSRGNLLAESDAFGNTRRYTYDERSNRTSATDAEGATTFFRYDPVGRLVSIIDPLGNETAYVYDQLDRVRAEVVENEGDLLVRQYQYDLSGNLRQVTDRLGRVRLLQYDALGRLQNEMWYATATDAFADVSRLNTIGRAYDAVGRLTAVSDNFSRYEYSFDALDRLTTTSIDAVALPPVVLQNIYTRQDELRESLWATVGDAADFVNRYFYDTQGRLERVDQTGNGVVEKRVDFHYTPTGQVSEIRRYAELEANSLVAQSQYDFDSQGRMTMLSHRQDTHPLAEYHWLFDAAHRVVSVQSLTDGVSNYDYDARGQLLAATYDSQRNESFAYDRNGNRESDAYQVGDRNLIESDGEYRYEYDAEGNRTRRVDLTTGRVTEYQWDTMNRLVRIVECDEDEQVPLRTVEYTYDVFGRRIGKAIQPPAGPVAVETYVYDGQNIVLRFTAGNLANRYLHGPMVDRVLADEQLDSSGRTTEVIWPLADHLGTVRDLALYDDESGVTSLANHITYDAFGGTLSETDAAVDHLFGFTGRETDAESELYYYRARYYDPRIGQFISEDPSGFEAGDPNLRRYVENSPTNRVDPTGMYGEDVHFYFNYYLARYLGFDQPSGWINSRGQAVSEAYIIAYFATRVDYDARTRPVQAGPTARGRFHFPDPGILKTVTRDDLRVSAALDAVGSTGDLEMFGVLLHIYQDSFAHEGFSKSSGHFYTQLPDVPFFYPARDFQMSQQVYAQMVNLLLARRGVVGGANSPSARLLLTGKSFAGFWSQVQGVMLQKPRTTKSVSPSARRIVGWEQLIIKDFRNARPRFNDRQPYPTNSLTERFRAVSEKVPVWYGKGYYHQQHWGQWQPVQPNGPPPWNTNGGAKYKAEMNPMWFPPYGKPKF